ncbi:hypothetical protein BC_3959 [Bacillus cereus ATCC 14579]|uniref:Uncharacterized protein n=1 Tax=Bacillus cereus (strain ATCC 14579 / DSM 31 / CCUG 7414 / JCM 2152 / NBRC 15305 / NCIMB 9373 / NCTC 2599 / NRRL B-3711) TaxID=226900 RepID=Q819L7_BACCR|nr:hypothetical protein BC_3959 [Bacillus cereus ATCC 14579]EEK93353.1 hypothetical protein bcere0012_36730 [Bacillus cereus BDRD-ST24]EEL10029.1 hypothetical protein bcere0015_36810 [Bacillus cereus BDRD-Cer4]EEL27105.1 hypothetical protein bcere0018_36750 [Bacillus cereus Rock1-15]EEL75057.1 hypothetical protein bcere0027_36270 [Bacillus cereus AH676]EEM46449.1 hypothetical protein bthur0005_36900 [Bacillus thuringiensis serovar pakistani str. T13001]
MINALKRTDAEKRIPVLRLELDYELATLYDAMMEDDNQKKEECVQKLEVLRLEMIRLEA